METELLDSMDEPTDAPLPAPTTVTSRSLRPRKAGGRSTRSNSRSTASSSSQSRSSSLRPPQTFGDVDTSMELPPAMDEDIVEVKSEGRFSLEPVSPETQLEDGSQNNGARKRRKLDEEASVSGNAPIAGPSTLTLEPGDAPESAFLGEAHDIGSATIVDDSEWSVDMDRVSQASPGDSLQPDPGSSLFPDGLVDDPAMCRVAGTSLQGQQEVLADGTAAEPSITIDYRSGPIDVDAQSEIRCPVGPPPPTSSASVGNSGAKKESSLVSVASSSEGSSSKQTAPPAQQQPVTPTDEPLSAYTCPVCFSPPTRATLTPCGHICCGECLFTAVKTTLQRATYAGPANERPIARCPVCRAPIPGWDGRGGGVIGLKPKIVFSL